MPDCAACLPFLMQENVDVIRVYMAIRGQVRVAGMGDVVDLDHTAVWKFIEKSGIENQLVVFDSVVALFHRRLEEARDKRG